MSRLLFLGGVFAALLVPSIASATCFDRCELDCLWEEYLEKAQESIDDARRAERFQSAAGDAYGAALDAAQAQLDAVIDAVNPVSLPSATDALPPLAQRVMSYFTTANNLLNGLGNVQGGLVLERMGQIAMENSGRSWAQALRALNRHKECVEEANTPTVEPAPTPEPAGGPTLGSGSETELLGRIADPKPHTRREGARGLAGRTSLEDGSIRKIKQRLGVESDTLVRFWLVVALGLQGERSSVALPQIVGHNSTDLPLIFESLRACSLIDSASQPCQELYGRYAEHEEAAIRELAAQHRTASPRR